MSAVLHLSKFRMGKCLAEAIAQIDSLLVAVVRSQQEAAVKSQTSASSATVSEAPRSSKKESKKAASKAAAPQAQTQAAEDPFLKANLRVARVLDVGIVENSEKLYKLKVDAGGEHLQVLAGLRQYVPETELLDRLVVTVLNLKPAKLAGELSEAMILAADCTQPDGRLLVTPLQPPGSAQPGDAVYLEGGEAPAATPKTCKKEAWGAIVDKLRTAGHRPAYGGVPLCTAAGPVTVPDTMPDGSCIH